MKNIHLSVVNLSLFREKVIPVPEIEIPENFTFLDTIASFDLSYWENVKPNLSENEKKRILLIANCDSLLQVIWNPKTNQTYKDVMLEAREGFSTRTKLPILSDFNFILPEGAYLALGPDQGC
jgi:hypothetical protein